MIALIIYIMYIILLVYLSSKSDVEFDLVHSKIVKYIYKAFYPFVVRFPYKSPCNKDLQLLYPNISIDELSTYQLCIKLSVFSLMSILPVMLVITRASFTVCALLLFLWLISPMLADVDAKQECIKVKQGIVKDFSSYLSRLTLYMNSGMNLYAALTNVEYDKNSVFGRCMLKLVHNIEVGTDIEHAFLQLSISLPISQIHAFCSIMIYAFRNSESGVQENLKQYASQIWAERKFNARKKAEEASAKSVIALAIGLIGIMLVLTAPAIFMLSDW